MFGLDNAIGLTANDRLVNGLFLLPSVVISNEGL